jgi:hypothetical protein
MQFHPKAKYVLRNNLFEDKTSLFVLIFYNFLEFNQLSHTLLFLK